MFASITDTPGTLSFAASPNASTVGAETLHTTEVPYAVMRDFLDVVIGTLARDADRHERAVLEFHHARRHATLALVGRDRLGNDRADPVQIHDPGEPLAHGARSGHDRILQFDSADAHAHIYHDTAS
jgi:hypothetical protein